jgi:hypothetical protein
MNAEGYDPERHSFSRVQRRETQLLAIAKMQARAITRVRHPRIPGQENGLGLMATVCSRPRWTNSEHAIL